MRFAFSLVVLVLSLFSSSVWALFGNSQSTFSPANEDNRFVTVDEAFAFNAVQQGARVYLDWQIKPDYYLYQDKIAISGEHITLGDITLRQGEPYHDEFFGDVNIYTTPLFVEVPLAEYQAGARLMVQYQGCAKAGFCYPPETKVIDLTSFDFQDADVVIAPISTNSEKTPITTDTATDSSRSQQAQLADRISESVWTPLLFLALGIGLAFTPCVLPMYPILTSIVLGGGQINTRRALGLSFVYVQGMALTYTLLGLVVAQAGLQFQAAMQHPAVLIGLSVLFVALALSMFGLYTLQLPSRLQTWLNQLSNQQQGGNLVGVFSMGAISGLVCSPCTTAPLSGALLYVAQSGDLFTGGITLYALALGMGIPLILVAVFGNQLLPKAGEWMNRVKTLFGFILLAAPIFLLERILPELWSSALWSGLGIAAFGWLYHSKNALPFGGWKQSVVGIVAVLGLFASAQPLLNLWFDGPSAHSQAAPSIEFTRINNVAELNLALSQAREQGKPVMLDFYADWCVACKEFEKYTFHQADVEAKLSEFVLLQADVTRNQVQDIELLKQLGVLGLPTIDFWDANGQPMPHARITGFMPAETFLAHLEASYPKP
ncbi:protein-disulfide reductase DsbD [Vibrio cholerae]